MSREERRAYQRQMKGMERGPALPPAAKARAERAAQRRSRRKPDAPEAKGAFTTRWLIRSILIAFAVGFLAFSLQWPQMPWALYVGLAVGVIAFGLLAGFRLLQGRLPTPPTS
jgi:hypothetical protein